MKTLKFLKRMGLPALQHYDLVKIAFYSSSPTVAYQSARALYASKRLANSCRYLAIIMRDRGLNVFQFVVQSSVSYPINLFPCYAKAWNFEQMLYCGQRERSSDDQTDEYSPISECFHFSHYYEDYYDCPYCGNCHDDQPEEVNYESAREDDRGWEESEDANSSDGYEEEEWPSQDTYKPESTEDETDAWGLVKDGKRCFSSCGNKQVDLIAAAIQRAAGTSYPVVILDDDSFNACANGSEVMLNQGLLNNCNRDELAFVIAHEVVHNARMHRDGNILLIRSYGVKAADLMREGITLKRLIGAFAVCFLGALHFSKQKRDNERESDREAKRLILEAGFDPTGAITLLHKFTDRKPGWFDTHPPPSERIENVKNAYLERR